MKLKSIKIENFKSFGNDNNLLILEDINTIIGKNESGKSNLIECLSKINLSGIDDRDFFLNINKYTKLKPKIGIVLIPSEEEKNKLKGETLLTINNRFDIDIEGSLTESIKNNTIFQNNRDKMNELNQNVSNLFSDQEQRKHFKDLIEMINNAENKIFINYTYIDGIINKINKSDEFSEFLRYLQDCISYLNSLKNSFPTFIEIDNITLKSKYTRKNLVDDNDSKIMLIHLLNAMEMDMDYLMRYWDLDNQADKENYIEDFNYKIQELISKFNDFYSQERVYMKASFENDSLNFVVKTTKKYMDFDERSNGLKWYLNMYIQLVSKTKNSNINNYVILIDEPGVYLHVNAQKEVLKLFEDLSKKNNMIIYTTHSPFMIYENKLYRVRLIIKDENGNSNIGNKYYSLPHKMGSKTETITPLLTAIGMNMNYNILSFNSQEVNIITEGISDYNYIKGYFLLTKEKMPNIIPSTSVDNIHNIVSILIGWGCNFKIIMDQDNSGRGQYKVLINKGLTDISNISFVDGLNIPDNKKTITIEDIFSEKDKQQIGITNEDYKEEKAYYSLETLKRIENKDFEYDQETMCNFAKIIFQLFD